ncbi:threonine ammonia-lyase, biosynthetic [Methylophilus sp. 5]|uniref:threonine ammonia-lyase, biosynthetic n=1 Tax=Methylophilus sp. 5 TaxID=1112274 RepID=UPI00048D3135|nr:threonine ammonia-lyase, biosynthetic [Methylophilus sp. 5]
MTINYREKIEHSQVYAVARHTPLDEMPNLSARAKNRVLLKREDMQPVFSFKLRGAYNKMAHLPPDALARGVICASAGNHAQGVALSAQKMGCRAVIVMPTTTPAIKVNAVRARGAEVVLFGDSYSDAYAHALEVEKTEGLTFVHPYDDPDVIAGQGTIALEIVQDHPEPIEAIFCCVGGGGLLAGIAAYIKAVRPEIKVIGVEAQDAEAMTESLKIGQRVMLEQVGLFADGAAVKQVGEHTFALVQQYVDDMIVVDNDEVCAAIKDVFEDTRSILEPAGALALAGLKAYSEKHQLQGKTMIAVASGANMNFDRLRFIAERAELGEHREAVFAVTIPEAPGAFKAFCRQLGNRNITEFNYRFADSRQAHIFVGLAVHNPAEAADIASGLSAAGLPTLNLSDNEMAKLHLRHLVGGHAPQAQHEVVYRFEFPEKPGALMNFLESMGHNWNISLFHYRNHGADFGRVLVGMQVPPDDKAAFEQFLQQLGYPYWDESQNPAYRLFLG